MRGEAKEEVGQLVVDEMKLRKDVIMNVSSNDIVGVTDDFISTKKIIKSLLDDNSNDFEDIDDFNEPASYAKCQPVEIPLCYWTHLQLRVLLQQRNSLWRCFIRTVYQSCDELRDNRLPSTKLSL